MRYVRRLYVLLFLTLAAAGGEAQAQTTFTVDTLGTLTHGSCSPGSCTLPDAIVAANTTPGADIIEFNLPGSGVQTIALDAALPTIGEAVTINGYTQPGAAANTAATGALDGTLLVEIIGTAGYYDDGLTVAASNVVIRGLIFSGFINDVHLASGTGIALQGCYLGTLPDGSAIASPTSDRGVLIEYAASATIGGSTAAARNLIAGHGLDGIRVDRGSGAVSAVTIAGNLIGTDRLAQSAIPNGTGILVETGAGTEAHTLTIGGSAAEDGNIIAGNAVGIAIDRFAGEDALTAVNTIQNNHLGVNAAGAIIPNTGNAVAFTGASMGLLSFNIIRGNGGAGVSVEGPTAAGGRGVLIVENSISENDGLAIDLGPVGRTPNDADDADTGANHLQNFPVLTRVTSTAGGTTYEGTLRSVPSTMFMIELFDNGTVDRPGRDSAAMALRTFVTTDVTGLAAFTVGSPTIVPVGHFVSATISDTTGGTSEVSDSVRARPLGVRIGGTLTYNGTIAIAGAAVTLSGAAASSTTTNAGGYYEFDGLTPGGSYTVTPALDGYVFVPASQTIPALISDSVRDFAATAVPLTYTVNSTNDPGDGICDAAECTLHEAMEAANQHPGPDAISFAIAPSGVRQTILLNGPLPAILEPLVIDGFTQPGAAPNTNATGGLNANVLIDIDGNGQTFGLGLGVGPSTIRGLSLHNFALAPIAIGNVNAPVHDVTIEGSLIGLTPEGPGPRTEYFGILLLNDVHDIRIGGALPAARNAISNHGSAGIFVTGGEGATSEVTILGNLIGTTADGATAAPNAVGIARETLGSGTGATLRIGGAAPGEGNVISGNETAGILINTITGPDPAAIVQELLHNDIGLAADGVSALPNLGPGVSFLGQVKALVAGNRIAHNGDAGVQMSTTTTPEGFGVTLSQNLIYANAGLAIDLNADGRSANDPLDADAGANDTQNFPAIAAAQALLDGTTQVAGQLDSAPATSYLVELFAADGTGTPGTTAPRFAGSVTVTTDGSGVATFSLSLPGLRAGDLLSATATTTSTGLTSELSDVLAIAPVPLHTITGTVLENGAPLADVTIALSGTTTASTTTDASGRYTFANLPEGGSFTVMPSLANYAFTPPQTEVIGLAADRTVDFAATLLIRSRFITEGATGSSGRRRCRC